jgi:predicted HAD superfamily hydrolase
MKISYSLSDLISRGRTLAETVEVVSFDLFDTLLIRRIHDPDLVKLPVARYIASLAANYGLKWSWQRVQKLRDTIEKRHRQETGQKFEDFEACYPHFMRELLGCLFKDNMSDALFESVAEYEMAMENSMLVPRGELADWLIELHGQGKRIFIVSDIYLPAVYLEKLVKHAGLLPYVEKVISSADTFLAKASGKAFPLLQERFGLDPAKWLHVGDNPFSDGLRPEEFGLCTLVLHDASEKRRKSVIRRQITYSAGLPFWRGRALQQLMAPLEQENTPCSDLYIEGYNFLGPLIGGFVQHIAERVRELHIGKVFFLSREGWTFKKYWELSVPLLYPDKCLPDTEYMYVSRMALAGASCAYQGLTQTNADIAFLPSGNADFLDVCRIFSLQSGPFAVFLQRHQLDQHTVLSPLHKGFLPENRVRFNEMLEDQDFQEEVKTQTRPANDALQLYLEDLGFFAQKSIALVDIGWLGTIQRFFYEAIAHRKDAPRCHGFLFGATRGILFPTTPDNSLEGVWYDKYHFDMAGSSVLYARDVFEEACRAPHPTLNGYRLSAEKGYRLEFRGTDDAIGQAEQEQDSYFQPLQQGIFDSARRYGAASSLLGYSAQEYKPWFNFLLQTKLAFPTSREVSNIRHKHHLDDFHGSKKVENAFARGPRQLWDSTALTLRCNPFIRLQLFLRHMKERINE